MNSLFVGGLALFFLLSRKKSDPVVKSTPVVAQDPDKVITYTSTAQALSPNPVVQAPIEAVTAAPVVTPAITQPVAIVADTPSPVSIPVAIQIPGVNTPIVEVPKVTLKKGYTEGDFVAALKDQFERQYAYDMIGGPDSALVVNIRESIIDDALHNDVTLISDFAKDIRFNFTALYQFLQDQVATAKRVVNNDPTMNVRRYDGYEKDWARTLFVNQKELDLLNMFLSQK